MTPHDALAQIVAEMRAADFNRLGSYLGAHAAIQEWADRLAVLQPRQEPDDKAAVWREAQQTVERLLNDEPDERGHYVHHGWCNFDPRKSVTQARCNCPISKKLNPVAPSASHPQAPAIAEQLRPYLNHLVKCSLQQVRYERQGGYFHNPIPPCDCGLDALLSASAVLAPPDPPRAETKS